MPTENRSSNTEMVSDSEMTECQFHNNCGGWCETRRELEHNLCEHCLEAHDEEMASPAQQHKVEPVAWIYSRPEGQVEPVVLLNRASEGDRGSWDETPLYTRADPADPGEVERLRAQVDTLAGWCRPMAVLLTATRSRPATETKDSAASGTTTITVVGATTKWWALS